MKINKTAQLIKVDKELFQKFLVISKSRDIDLEHVLSYELSPVPLSITHMNGEMRKTTKSQLLKELTVDIKEIYDLPIEHLYNSCFVIDLMGIVQSIKAGDSKTFGYLCFILVKSLSQYFRYADILVISPDRYDVKDSIKSFERAKRSAGHSIERIIRDKFTPLPRNFKDYLSNLKNKSRFIEFFLQYAIAYFEDHIQRHQQVIVGLLNGSVWRIDIASQEEIEGLHCDHEEANSRMFVYSAYLNDLSDLRKLIIFSPDTDVAVISMYQLFNSLQSIQELWFLTGFGKYKRFIQLHEIANELGASICKMLPTFHCLTGCDSTASFTGIGKRKAMKILKEKKNELLWYEDLRSSPILDVNSEYIKDAVKFICWLYNSINCENFDINKL